MLDALIGVCLRRRALVLGATAALLAVGAYRTVGMPIDIFPDVTAPRVTVVTEVGGMATEEVERLVTFPIETAVNGVAGVRRVRSASSPGISIVWVEFDWDSSDAEARQRTTERLQSIGESLPPSASAPALAPSSSVMGEIAFVAATSETLTPLDLRRVVDVQLRRRLLAVPGVSSVVAIGGQQREHQVLLDPELLERFDLTLHEVIEAVERGSHNAPGGYVVEAGQESVVRVLGRASGTEDLSAMVVARRGDTAVRLGQLGLVRVGAAVARGTGSYRAGPAVVLSVSKQPTADTLAVTAAIDAALDDLQPALRAAGVTVHRDLFRQADFIERSIDNLVVVLRDGVVLVVLVLGLFLLAVRPTLISTLAIPISLVVAVLALDALGMSLDTMTIGGLAIAVGVLVDDAIVDVENVVRRLRERLLLPEPERPRVFDTVLRASVEIRGAIVSATAILILDFIPLLFLDGLEGRLLRPLAVAYLVAIGASLLVAVTITPALCLLLLPSHVERRNRTPAPMRLLSRAYAPVLSLSLRHPVPIALGAALLTAAGALGGARLGRSFLPEFNEGALTIAAVTLPGTSLAHADELGRLAEQRLLEDPAVVATARRTGRAERDEHVQGVEAAEMEVQLRADPRGEERLVADLRRRLSTVPGLRVTIGQPLSHRIDHMVSGQRAALSIKVVGEDLSRLRETAERIRSAVSDVPGLVDLDVEQMVDIPQIVVRIDPDAAADHGMSTGEAATAVGTALWGHEAGRVYEHGTTTPIVVRFEDGAREDLEALRRVRLPTPSGALVPVSALADVTRDTGPNYILREDVRRRVVVTANVAGRDLRGVYEDVRAAVRARVPLADGVHVEYAGQFEREEATGSLLLVLGAIAILGIALIIGTTLGSARRTLIVLVNLPLAAVGGVLGVYASGGVLTVASMIGFITLFGIAARNGILLATRANDLEAAGAPRRRAVALAADERLAPILMTAATAALGLLPLALAMGEAGSEIQAPMAVVILWGLSTSTVLNMIVVPALLARWGGAITAPDTGPTPAAHGAMP